MKNIYFLLFFLSVKCFAQDNYEIQIYSSPTMPVGSTIFELHSNYTPKGETQIVDGVRPTQNSFHETIEITTGVAKNFEIGFYFFTNHLPNYGFQFVGSHIRPRFAAPESWHLPFGFSLSAEIGGQRKEYAADYWNMEVRPIFDKSFGNFFIAFNPTFDKAFQSSVGYTKWIFSPQAKISYQVSKKAALGVEYYSTLGNLRQMPEFKQQSHAIYGVLDLYLDPNYEFDFGVGWGLTPATDGLNIKLILGRKTEWKKSAKKSDLGKYSG